MSGNSTSTTVQLSTTRQVLEISNNIFDCKILFVIETENEAPFEFNVVDDETLKKNEFTLNRVENGYATGTARNIQQPTFLVITSPTRCSATITLQHIKNPIRKQAASAPSATPIQHVTSTATAAATQKKFYQQMWFKVLLAVVILAAAYTLYKRMKSPAPGAAVPAKKAVTAPASSLSIDPTSNDESSFGF